MTKLQTSKNQRVSTKCRVLFCPCSQWLLEGVLWIPILAKIKLSVATEMPNYIDLQQHTASYSPMMPNESGSLLTPRTAAPVRHSTLKVSTNENEEPYLTLIDVTMSSTPAAPHLSSKHIRNLMRVNAGLLWIVNGDVHFEAIPQCAAMRCKLRCLSIWIF